MLRSAQRAHLEARTATAASSNWASGRRGYQFHIAASREQAIREAAPHYEENVEEFGELRLVRALTDEQMAAMRDPRLVGTVRLPEDRVKAGGFLAGRLEDIIEALKAVEKRYPRPRHPRDAPRSSARRRAKHFKTGFHSPASRSTLSSR